MAVTQPPACPRHARERVRFGADRNFRSGRRPTFQRSPRKGRSPPACDCNRPDPEWPLYVCAVRRPSP